MLTIGTPVLEIYRNFQVFLLAFRHISSKTMHRQNSGRTSSLIKSGTSMGTMYVLKARTDPCGMGMRAIKLPIL